MRQGSETPLSETKGGGAHAKRVVGSDELVELFREAHCSAFALSTICRQKMEPAWAFDQSMVWVPVFRPNRRMDIVKRSSHQGHRFVSSRTTVIVCIR